MGSDIVRRQSIALKSVEPKTLLRAVTKVVGKAGIQEFHEGEGLLFLPMFRDEMPTYSELGPFQRIRIVMTARRFPTDGSSRMRFLDALRRFGSERVRMFVRTEGAEAAATAGIDLVLRAGWDTLNRTGGPLAVPTTAPMCGVQLGEDSPGAKDLAYRRDLFERVATAMGCSDVVRFELKEGGLVTSVAEGWQATFSLAELGGRNARGFTLYGFDDIEAAVEAGERVLKSLFRRVDENSFLSFTSEEADYETLRSPLNSLIDGWEVEVLAHLTNAAATVLADDLPNDEPAPNRLPAFKWEKHRGQPSQILGELVAVDGGYVLELSSMDATPEQLEACIAAVEGRAPKKKSQSKSQGSDPSATKQP